MYGPLAIVGSILALVALIALGLFLCRYNLKFVILSIVGLLAITIYLSYSFSVYFVEARELFILEPVFLVLFFCTSLFVLVRFGIYMRSKKLIKSDDVERDRFRQNVFNPKNKIMSFLKWFTQKDNLVICLIASVVFGIHLIYINSPYPIGDENFYVGEANRILHGQALVLLEHPPLGKWFIAIGIFIFGNNGVGWRIIPVIFGIASIFIFYFICVELVQNFFGKSIISEEDTSKWFQPTVFIPVLATFLFAFENLSFVLAHIAMLDVFYVTLMLLGLLFYLKHSYLLCGISMGLSLLCKETAIFGIVALGLHWLITHRIELIQEIKYTWSTLQSKRQPELKNSEITHISIVPITVAALWILLLPPLEYVRTRFLWGNLFTRTWYIIWHNLQLAPVGQGPHDWVTAKTWTWLFWQHLQNINPTPNTPHYIADVSFSIWVLLIPTILYLVFQTFKDIRSGYKNSIAVFAFCWFMTIYGLFIIFELVIKRPMYLFYIYPVVPAICLIIALGSWRLWDLARTRPITKVIFLTVLLLYLFGTLASFVIMSPIGTSLIKLPL